MSNEPKSSYLKYLPAIYQEDAESKEFLERFLYIFESSLNESDQTISDLPKYFDPLSKEEKIPKEFYRWLANWVSLDLYDLLGDRNREFILRSVEFYKQKGTVAGLKSLVSFLTGRRCCIKEYMNNVFRSYGMEHDYTFDNKEIDEHGCSKFYHKISKTVNTEDSGLISSIGTYYDELHYVMDASEEGIYSPHVIGIFIFIRHGEELIIEDKQLLKIIKSFLPVFVRAEIITVVEFEEVYEISTIIDEHKDYVHGISSEEFKDVRGDYIDRVNWKWLYSYSLQHNDGRANDLNYRTPHSKIDVLLEL